MPQEAVPKLPLIGEADHKLILMTIITFSGIFVIGILQIFSVPMTKARIWGFFVIKSH